MKNWAVTMFFPNRCCLCGEIILQEEHMCMRCKDEAPFVLPPICSFCGRGEERCACNKKRRLYDRCVVPFYYEDQAHKGIGTLKNQGYAATVDGFAQEMAELVRREYGGIAFDMIAPVPLYPTDLRRRGFNQSALLARALSMLTGIPHVSILVKLFPTEAQKELSAARRDANVLGVFDVTEPDAVVDKTVLLVDDVITTGSTLNECAKMLKIYGAREVYAITAAAAILKKSANSV